MTYNLKRAAPDYAALAQVFRHASWMGFLAARDLDARLVLMTTSGSIPLDRFTFVSNDTILLGRETAGGPSRMHERADARVRISLRTETRSLNVAQAGAIALYEALRQTGGLPAE